MDRDDWHPISDAEARERVPSHHAGCKCLWCTDVVDWASPGDCECPRCAACFGAEDGETKTRNATPSRLRFWRRG